MSQSIILLLILALVAPAGSADTTATHTSVTLIPPGPVSDKIEVEIRLAVFNNLETVRDVTACFYADRIDPSNVIGQGSAHLPGNGHALISAWWPTAGHSGHHELLFHIEEAGHSIAQGTQSIDVIASETPALPMLQAGWADAGALVPPTYPQARPTTPQDVRNKVDAMNAVGMKTIIFTYVEAVIFGSGPFYPTEISELGHPPLEFDVVGLILDQAAINGQHVFLGLGRGSDLYLTWDGFNDPARLQFALDLGKRVAQELWDLYSHYPSFYGWYLTHEANDIAGAGNYYNPMADFLHEFSPDKPVLISPAGTPILSPSIIRNSHVDIFAYQDAVGSGYVPYQYTYDPQRRIAMLDQVFSSYQAAHQGTGKHLWSNLELWEMSGPTYGNAYPADFSRVRQQIEIHRKYVQMITGYEFLGMMEHPDSTLELGGPKAVQLYRDYRDYLPPGLLNISQWLVR